MTHAAHALHVLSILSHLMFFQCFSSETCGFGAMDSSSCSSSTGSEDPQASGALDPESLSEHDDQEATTAPTMDTNKLESSNFDPACDVKDAEESADVDASEEHDVGNKQTHALIRNLGQEHGWPDGPDNVQELFCWQEYNADRLMHLDDQEKAKKRLLRLMDVLSRDIDIAECYAGTGNGACALHQQINALNAEIKKLLPETDVEGWRPAGYVKQVHPSIWIDWVELNRINLNQPANPATHCDTVTQQANVFGNAIIGIEWGPLLAHLTGNTSRITPGHVFTSTSCDNDPVCRNVLMSLPQDSGLRAWPFVSCCKLQDNSDMIYWYIHSEFHHCVSVAI